MIRLQNTMHRMPTRIRCVAVALWGGSVGATAQAPADIRVALVIGNSGYAAAPLLNPANDARSMGEALKTLGFTVVEARDANRDQMEAAIVQVHDALKGKHGVGMLYYAGHGLQLDWHNYMVPVDARIRKAGDVPTQTVDVQSVIDAFRDAGNRMNIVVLDACRDNPFAASGAKGLAQMDAPPNTFLAYATAPGNVAEDGDARSGNGLYTRFLIAELKNPAARIEDVFKRVRLNVRKQSEGRQIPWESTSLEDDFYFRGGTVAAGKPDRRSDAMAFDAERIDWEKVKDSKNAADFYSYVQKYPSGFVSEQAQLRIEQLQKGATVVVPNRDGVVTAVAASRRFEVGDEWVDDTIDGFTKIRQRRTRRIVYADDVRAEERGGRYVWDQTGALIKNLDGTHSPGILFEPAEMVVGKKWRSAYQTLRPEGVTETSFWDFRVTGYDTVTVPAGTFKAFLVVGRGEARFPGGITYMESRGWFDPATLQRLRYESIFRNGGKISSYFEVEAVSLRHPANR